MQKFGEKFQKIVREFRISKLYDFQIIALNHIQEFLFENIYPNIKLTPLDPGGGLSAQIHFVLRLLFFFK